MKVKIPLKGITTTPVYEDGDMISLVNLRNKAGAFEPVPPRKVSKVLEESYTHIFQHRIPKGGVNLLGVRDGGIYMINQFGIEIGDMLLPVDSFNSMSQIGNVVNVIADGAIKYIVWYENEYKVISTDFDGMQSDTLLAPVKVDLMVDSQTKLGNVSYRNYYKEELTKYEYLSSHDNDEKGRIETIKGLLAKGKSDITKDGGITGMALVCTALELFDGTYIFHSQPTFIGYPNDKGTRYEGLAIGAGTFDYMNNKAVFASLLATNTGEDGYDILQNGVGSCSAFSQVASEPCLSFPNGIGETFMILGPDSIYSMVTKTAIYNNILSFKINATISETLRPIIKSLSVFMTKQVDLYDNDNMKALTIMESSRLTNYSGKVKTNTDIIEELSKIGSFYKVHEIPFDDLRDIEKVNSWTPINLKGKLGDNLFNQEILSVDNFTHHALKPLKQYIYNSRLHIQNYSMELSRGFPFQYFYANQGIGQFESQTGSPPPREEIFSRAQWVKVYIKTETGISEVVRYSTGFIQLKDMSPMLSYPDSRAIRMVIYKVASQLITSHPLVIDYRWQMIDVKLTPSESNNFSFYISPNLKPIPFHELTLNSQPFKTTVPEEVNRQQVFESNIKVSELSNPFTFPLLNTYTVGNGKGMNMASNAKGVSEGQFGQYPLYVFTDNGIYAMQVGQGKVAYSEISPISLETPTSDILCETPFGVIYTGKRGLYIINGQNVEPLTTQLETYPTQINLDIPKIGVLPNRADIKTWNDHFLEYLDGITEIVYDNKESELILLNPSKGDYNFVYNIPSKMWYQSTEIVDGFVQNAQPELYGLRGKDIIDFSRPSTTGLKEEPVKTAVSIITRPLNFGLYDLKKLERLILRARLDAADDVIILTNNAIDDINFSLDKGMKLNNANYKDIYTGMMTKKYRQIVLMFSAKLGYTSRIYSIDAMVEKANNKMI